MLNDVKFNIMAIDMAVNDILDGPSNFHYWFKLIKIGLFILLLLFTRVFQISTSYFRIYIEIMMQLFH